VVDRHDHDDNAAEMSNDPAEGRRDHNNRCVVTLLLPVDCEGAPLVSCEAAVQQPPANG
jgi:hypothetical protein